jgi:hypothetical protein
VVRFRESIGFCSIDSQSFALMSRVDSGATEKNDVNNWTLAVETLCGGT